MADVAFIEGKLYAILAGAGCSHGLAGTNNGMIRVDSSGNWSLIANLSDFQKAPSGSNPEPNDFEPDGTWYSMLAAHHQLFAVEPNHGELDVITTSGQMRRLADISLTQGHIVPTAIAYNITFTSATWTRFPSKLRRKFLR